MHIFISPQGSAQYNTVEMGKIKKKTFKINTGPHEKVEVAGRYCFPLSSDTMCVSLR